MPYDINTPIRVGDLVTKEILGQIALEIDALHDGFVTGSASSFGAYSPSISSLDNPSGIVFTNSTPPAAIYTFSNNYSRRPPYLLIGSASIVRTTDTIALGWIVRQPHIYKDPGRETSSVTAQYNAWGAELAYNSIISNIEGANPPDGTWNILSTTRLYTMMRIIEDDLPRRFTYSGGTSKVVYNDYFHLVFAPSGGSASNALSVYDPVLTLIGGR